ncbi:MAG: hypothetical protein AMK70_02075 [Nitrospira bacterium SG8_35_1]|nr:MAG: hypothetical protein AMK70_02075 [Nitrospira bacterium SG8_35_1]
MATYSTPGVFVEEIRKFPPSVAAVETAIPAFIGYTETASFKGENLEDKAIRISSLLDYEERFGSGPSIDVTSVSLDENNNVVSSTVNSTYYLYDSLRLFFDNGGGDCYIISIGRYTTPASIDKDDLLRGLEEVLVKVDEPTLIVFPDGIALTKTQLTDLYKQALDQCNTLKDRFLIADVHMTDPASKNVDFTNDIDNFRTNIGTKYLSYGAAYFPYLETSIGREVNYRDVKDKIKKLGADVDWSTYVDPADTDTLTLIQEMDQIVTDLTLHLEPDLNNFIATKDAAFTDTKIAKLEDVYLVLRSQFYALARATSPVIADVRGAFRELINYIYEITEEFIDNYANDTSTSPITFAELLTQIRSAADELAATPTNHQANPTLDTLAKIDNNASNAQIFGATSDFPNYGTSWTYSSLTAIFVGTNVDTTLNDILPNPAASDSAERIENMMFVEPILRTIFYKVYAAINSYMEDAHNTENQKQTSMILQIPVLKNVIEKLENDHFLLPPSSAVAGIYASVDSDRGVFKAPANVSINSVSKPTLNITISENDRLNVDVGAGKSINAIKAFTGKGTLVWGSRTLAGNDNEWRYIPVRRFFIFAEESIKKATEPFVFEPNDANTWTKVKAMITNFLTIQWRAGALAGAKPSQAFYVKAGLGETMTSVDILEGRLIVEVGLAVVRPAEFIILRFSHKMQEA